MPGVGSERASLVAQLVKNPPAMQETPVRFLGWEDSPGEGVGYPLRYSWASLVAQRVKNPPAMQETLVRFLGWEDSPGEGIGYPLPVFLGFPCGSAGKESAGNAGDLSLIPGLGRFPWRRERLPTLDYSGLENSMDCIVYWNENHNHRKLIKLITWTIALSNSMKP